MLPDDDLVSTKMTNIVLLLRNKLECSISKAAMIGRLQQHRRFPLLYNFLLLKNFFCRKYISRMGKIKVSMFGSNK